MKTTRTNTAMTANLDAVRAQAKAHSTQLAAPAAVQPAPAEATWPADQAIGPIKVSRHVRARPAAPAKTVKLEQCNVRLTPTARQRVRAAALACQVSEQELIERWAMTLPEPVGRPPLPWERPDRCD